MQEKEKAARKVLKSKIPLKNLGGGGGLGGNKLGAMGGLGGVGMGMPVNNLSLGHNSNLLSMMNHS